MAGRVRKVFKRLCIALLVLIPCLWIAAYVGIKTSIAKPPPLPPEAAAMQKLEPVERDGKIWLGRSWMQQRDGLPVVYLTGTPFEMGYANGRLTRDLHYRLEGEFLEMVRGYVPQEWVLNLLKNYVIWRNRRLPDFVSPEYQMEIFGGCLGGPDIRPEQGPYFNRRLNYHAAHDVSYMMIDNPLVARAGCTAFGAWGGATADGSLITGRNFDWEAAEVFSRDRLVTMFEPKDGIPFVSVSWAGMSGVVSGMNREGISITLNGAPSELPDDIGTPSAFVARDVLQKARNLAEAVAILKEAKVFVSTLWLVGSRADGRFIVVEKTPTATNMREPEGDSIVCANHFLTPGLRELAGNTNYIAESTSLSREARLKELLTMSHGKISPLRAAVMLRDRRLPGGAFAGNGHRGTLNPLIATHAVVMDLTAGMIWVAKPPHQLGGFVAIDVADFSRELSAFQIPADTMLASDEFERARKAESLLKAGGAALAEGDALKAAELAAEAETLNPMFYGNVLLSARAVKAAGDAEKAAELAARALSARPAFAQERREAEELLRGGGRAK